MQRYRGIPRLMFLTRLKTYEKLVGTRKNIFFGVCRPAPKKNYENYKVIFRELCVVNQCYDLFESGATRYYEIKIVRYKTIKINSTNL